MVQYLIIKKSSLLYTKRPLTDSNFCLKECRFGDKHDSVLFTSCLILGLRLIECNLDFFNVLSI